MISRELRLWRPFCAFKYRCPRSLSHVTWRLLTHVPFGTGGNSPLIGRPGASAKVRGRHRRTC